MSLPCRRTKVNAVHVPEGKGVGDNISKGVMLGLSLDEW